MLGDLGLAVYEALANAAEHAYEPGCPAPPLRLTARLDHDHVLVSISDEGRWCPPGDRGLRGRGLSLMRQLVSAVDVEPGAQGTTVHLCAHLDHDSGDRAGHR